MVEISLSGSGEGPGEATTRGYSTAKKNASLTTRRRVIIVPSRSHQNRRDGVRRVGFTSASALVR